MKKRAKFNRYTLSLHLRAQAIREFNSQEPKPSIQSLANKYNVSFPQMKSILVKREDILKSYEEEFDEKRQQGKIQFLGRVMHEYIQRAMQQSIPIDDEHMLQKAKEVAECMGVVNFEITHSWLDDFKKSFDIKTLQQDLTLVEAKRSELTAFELIAYVSSMEVTPVNENIYVGNKVADEGFTSKAATISPPPRSPPENNDNPVVVNEMIIDNDFEEKPTIINMDSSPKECTSKSHKNSFDFSNVSMFEIKSEDEALKHLRLLEEFAMLQDNYRAIGLLTQLEKVFKQP